MKNTVSLKNRNVTWYWKHLQNSTEKVGEKGKKENIQFLKHFKIKKLHTIKIYLVTDS
jgi:hypothetical protein